MKNINTNYVTTNKQGLGDQPGHITSSLLTVNVSQKYTEKD